MPANVNDGPRLEMTPYTPISVLSVLAFLLGGLSSIAYLFPSAIAICFVGTTLAAVALCNIRRARGELAGRGLARAGLAASLFCTATATAFHYYQHRREVPRGALQITFRDLASEESQLDERQAWRERLMLADPAPREDSRRERRYDADELIGKTVSLRGYATPNSFNEAGDRFVLSIGSYEPKLEEVLFVQLAESVHDAPRAEVVSVTGRLERSDSGAGYVLQRAEIRPKSSRFVRVHLKMESGC